MKTKTKFSQFINELLAEKAFRYKKVKEESMPTGFFSSADLAKRCNIAHRVSQRWISEGLSLGELEVRFSRRKINDLFVKKIPIYKFKTKADEKSFKGRHKGKF
jgi:hypothetical protein